MNFEKGKVHSINKLESQYRVFQVRTKQKRNRNGDKMHTEEKVHKCAECGNSF